MKSTWGVAGAFAVSCTFIAPTAMAAPTLSGTYTLASQSTCQLEANVDSATGIISFANKSNLGPMTNFAGTMSFDPGTGTYSSTGTSVYMTALFEKFSDGSKKGIKPKTETNITDSGSYSNTDTTLTFKGADTYNVAYGHIDGVGVADSLVGVWQTPNGCMFQISLQLQ